MAESIKRLKLKKQNKKSFVRVLKELGIYKIWLDRRLSSSMLSNYENKNKHVFDFIYGDSFKSFESLIINSFYLQETGCYNLWNTICSSFHSGYDIKYLANSMHNLSELKKEIQKCCIKGI